MWDQTTEKDFRWRYVEQKKTPDAVRVTTGVGEVVGDAASGRKPNSACNVEGFDGIA